MKKITVFLLIFSLLLASCQAEGGGVTDASSSGTPSTDCTHTDGDNNGTCDKCQSSVMVTVDFYAINDLHGKFSDTENDEGVDELTTFIKSSVEADDHAVIISSGDMWQGASESNLTKGNIITEWMNDVGFDAMALGNHEFDWGEEFVKANAKLADFPFLAINIYDKSTNKLVDYCAPSVMVERGDLKIGIIGAIGDCYSSIAADKTEGIYFKTDSALTALVKAEAQKLRNEGADFIVYSIHDGYTKTTGGVASVKGNQISSYYDIELSRDGYVDLVFEGHTHRSYVLKDPYGVYHLQDGGDNEGISHVEVAVNSVNSESKVNKAEFVSSSKYETMNDDPIVNTLLEKYADEIAKGYVAIGKNDFDRNSDFLCQTVADLYYKKGLSHWGSRYDVVLGGGYIAARSPYNLNSGNVTYAMVQSLFPFDNPLVLCSIKGKDLKNKFLSGNNKSYFVSYDADTLKSISDGETYYVVVDTYTSMYGPNNLTEIEMLNPNIFARDLLADYIAAGGFTNSGKQHQTLSISEITAIGNALSDNAQTEENYITTGKIVQIHSTKYGNLTIADEKGNTLYIYGLYDENGNRYDKMQSPPQVGDTITVCAQIKKYIKDEMTPTIVEFVNAQIYVG